MGMFKRLIITSWSCLKPVIFGYVFSVSVIKMQPTTKLKHVGKRISFTEFHTLLRIQKKKAFMNGNKRVATRS